MYVVFPQCHMHSLKRSIGINRKIFNKGCWCRGLHISICQVYRRASLNHRRAKTYMQYLLCCTARTNLRRRNDPLLPWQISNNGSLAYRLRQELGNIEAKACKNRAITGTTLPLHTISPAIGLSNATITPALVADQGHGWNLLPTALDLDAVAEI